MAYTKTFCTRTYRVQYKRKTKIEAGKQKQHIAKKIEQSVISEINVPERKTAKQESEFLTEVFIILGIALNVLVDTLDLKLTAYKEYEKIFSIINSFLIIN